MVWTLIYSYTPVSKKISQVLPLKFNCASFGDMHENWKLKFQNSVDRKWAGNWKFWLCGFDFMATKNHLIMSDLGFSVWNSGYKGLWQLIAKRNDSSRRITKDAWFKNLISTYFFRKNFIWRKSLKPVLKSIEKGSLLTKLRISLILYSIFHFIYSFFGKECWFAMVKSDNCQIDWQIEIGKVRYRFSGINFYIWILNEYFIFDFFSVSFSCRGSWTKTISTSTIC